MSVNGVTITKTIPVAIVLVPTRATVPTTTSATSDVTALGRSSFAGFRQDSFDKSVAAPDDELRVEPGTGGFGCLPGCEVGVNAAVFDIGGVDGGYVLVVGFERERLLVTVDVDFAHCFRNRDDALFVESRRRRLRLARVVSPRDVG